VPIFEVEEKSEKRKKAPADHKPGAPPFFLLFLLSSIQSQGTAVDGRFTLEAINRCRNSS
jgi:hypothetical protein